MTIARAHNRDTVPLRLVSSFYSNRSNGATDNARASSARKLRCYYQKLGNNITICTAQHANESIHLFDEKLSLFFKVSKILQQKANSFSTE